MCACIIYIYRFFLQVIVTIGDSYGYMAMCCCDYRHIMPHLQDPLKSSATGSSNQRSSPPSLMPYGEV